MTYRTRLLAAFAYVLVLVIVALAVPLALSTQHRIDREVRAQAADGAQLVAASASGRLDQPGQIDTLVGKVARDLGARVIVVGRTGSLLADSARPGTRGVAYGSRPEIVEALAGRTVQGRRRSETLDAQLLSPRCPSSRRPHGRRRARHAERRRARSRSRRDQYALVGIGALALAFGLAVAWFVAGSLARPLGQLASTARRVGSGDLEARGAVEGSAEQQEVARAFNTMADRLTHALEAQREFVANASHQLRTPLTGLRLRLEAADRRTPSRRRRRPGGGRGRNVAPGATRHEPAHARLGRRARPAERGGRSRRAAREAEERWSGRAEHEGRRIVAGHDAATFGQGNVDDMATSLDNLIENALVHTPEGSTVSLTWGRDGPEAFIAVLDKGAGISPADAEAAFQRFRRGAARPAGRGGTGLGLAIVGALAARWGGSASLQPRAEGGTRAEIRLPAPSRQRSPNGPLT